MHSSTLSHRKPRAARRALVINLVLLVCVTVFLLVCVELFFRVHYNDPYRRLTPGPHNDTWTVQDNSTVSRTITVAYTHDGFKRWGNRTTNKTKVLILGDSFTEMRYVNNGEEWYAYLERAYPDAEFFVYGKSGAGTLDEYLTLNRYVDDIKPDIILWQFHFNDFSNNYYPAERNEYPLQNTGRRPYLENGVIVERLPVPFAFLREHSMFMTHLLLPFDRWESRQALANLTRFNERVHGVSWNASDAATSASFAGGFPQAFNTTVTIMQMARARAPNASFYFFSADSRPAWREALIADDANLTYIPGVSDAIARAEANGDEPKVPNDGHWNVLGNQIAGEYLANYSVQNAIFVKK